MHKNLYKRLFRLSVISSPIIALYGVTPVYVFNKVLPVFLVYAGLGLTLNVFIFWLINILLIKLLGQRENTWKWYSLSYLFTLLLHLSFIWLRKVAPPPGSIEASIQLDHGFLLAYPFFSIVAINTIILIICNSVLTAERHKTAEAEIQQLKVNNLEAQAKVLMQQLQPHFLFNTLSVLKSLIRENPDEAENYAVKLSDFLRYTVQMNDTSVVQLGEELRFTRDYIELQKTRFGDSLLCRIEVPEEKFQYALPAYALQILVENAIKHNSFTERRPLSIDISCSGDELTVCNNKVATGAAETTGTGLRNLNERYKILANTQIKVNNTAATFCVTIYLINQT